LLDTAFVIFHNTPARIFGPELEMHINCPESAFQAGSAVECFMQLKKWADQVMHHPSVSAAIETMCQPSNEISMREAYSRFGLLNMFVIISGKRQRKAFYSLYDPSDQSIQLYVSPFISSRMLLHLQQPLKTSSAV
jgi:hypothetical protein